MKASAPPILGSSSCVRTNRDEKDIIGYWDVLNTIHEDYEYTPLWPNYILQLHWDLYRYSEKDIGGKFKKTQNYISATDSQGNPFALFTPPDAL